MIRVACLHTAASNVAVFEDASARLAIPGLVLQHVVRTDLLEAAEAAGGLTPPVSAATEAALQVMAEAADAVLLTCSTLGPVAASVARTLRVDDALAQRAVRGGGYVIVLCALSATMGATTELFARAAAATGARADVRLVPSAWSAFKAGEHGRYLSLIADAVKAAAEPGATLALAQASIAPAASLCRTPVLTTPGAGLAAAVAAALHRSLA